MKAITVLVILGMAGLAISARAESPVASGSAAWQRVVELTQAAAPSGTEKVVLNYDPSTRLLKVGRELQLNPVTLRRHIQVVPIDRLVTEIPIEGVARLADPWVKIRTRDGREHVQVRVEREINGEPAAFDEPGETESRQSFLIIPCAPRQVPRLRDALQEFLQEEASRGTPGTAR